ncbi:hypothetical protein niasHT_019628 [Heterodera trifolii]|uniref:Uncharacterized protein n=1 Tax=Heterodera trifolii TaxID=157864 RepID=A0ABD2L828_9BILA
MEQQQTPGAGGGAAQQNGTPAKPAAQKPKIGDSGGKDRNVKKRSRARKEETQHMTEERIDKFISVRQEIEAKGHEIEDEEFDLNDEACFEACVNRLNMWDQCLDNAVRLEQRLLPHVIYDDAEHEAHHNDLIDVIQHVEPVRITNSGLEPLNGKLTEFINNPLNSSDNEAPVLPRAITGINHVTPSFDQIKQMIEAIRTQGDCPAVDILAPADNLTVYDAFVCKVLADVLDILKRQRFYTNLELIERDARARGEAKWQNAADAAGAVDATASGSSATTADGKGTAAAKGEDDPSMLAGPSSLSVEQHNLEGHVTSTHEKFLEAIQKGEIQAEGEDAVADGEDLDDEDESHSEACSEDYIDLVYSSSADAVTACDASVQQQQQEQADKTNNADENEERMDTDEHGVDSAAQQQQQKQPAQPQTTALDDSNTNENQNNASSSVSSATAMKVRLQQHQLNKLFSSAARLRSSPPLPPPSPSSVIKSEIIDLTLDDDDSSHEEEGYDDDELEIIDEANEDGHVKEEANIGTDDGPSSSNASPFPSANVAMTKAMTNGSGRRKRKSEDEEETDETGMKLDGKRRRKTEDDEQISVETVEDDDDSGDDDEQSNTSNGREEEEEDSTDVIEDSENDDGNGTRGEKRRGETMAKMEVGGTSSAVTSLLADDEEEGQKMTKNRAGDGNVVADDEDSIICLSDG